MEVRAWWSCRGASVLVVVQPVEQLGEVGAGEAPAERHGGLLIAHGPVVLS
jgi:hypothetical protein